MRSAIVAVPQEPYVFDSSVRLNADPTSCVSDEEIVGGLDKVKLWDLIEGRGGLDGGMEALGLSHGQKVMFGFARAVLRKRGEKGILLLDEVTSRCVCSPLTQAFD